MVAPEVSVHEPPVQLELTEDDAAAADRPPLLEKHRVATAPIKNLEPPVADAAFAAKLRHELERARQWDVCGPEPFMLMQLAREVHRRKTGGTTYATFLNQMPIDDDANTAASLFVRRIRPDPVEDLRRHEAYAPLVRATLGPANPETLVVRRVGFLFHYRDIVRDLAGGGAISESQYIGFMRGVACGRGRRYAMQRRPRSNLLPVLPPTWGDLRCSHPHQKRLNDAVPA
jgi:hypothetical protein